MTHHEIRIISFDNVQGGDKRHMQRQHLIPFKHLSNNSKNYVVYH